MPFSIIKLTEFQKRDAYRVRLIQYPVVRIRVNFHKNSNYFYGSIVL